MLPWLDPGLPFSPSPPNPFVFFFAPKNCHFVVVGGPLRKSGAPPVLYFPASGQAEVQKREGLLKITQTYRPLPDAFFRTPALLGTLGGLMAQGQFDVGGVVTPPSDPRKDWSGGKKNNNKGRLFRGGGQGFPKKARARVLFSGVEV